LVAGRIALARRLAAEMVGDHGRREAGIGDGPVLEYVAEVDDRGHAGRSTASRSGSRAHLAREGRRTPQLLGTCDQGISLSTRGSPGSPSTRSPRMLRWISDVPPSIELARDRRNILRASPGGPTRPRLSDRRMV